MTEALLDWRDSDRTETVSVPDGETILDAAAAADIGLPFGCRTGACGTCTARLLSGDVVRGRSKSSICGTATSCCVSPNRHASRCRRDGAGRTGSEPLEVSPLKGSEPLEVTS